MKILFNLIGEQPIPNLLPILYLQPDETVILFTDKTFDVANRLIRVIKKSSNIKTIPKRLKINAYDIGSILNTLSTAYKVSSNNEYIFNITGGTKLMSIGMFQFAVQNNGKVIYLKSEEKKNLLYTMTFGRNEELLTNIKELPELLNVDLFLKAHLVGYELYKPKNENDYGIEYENAIINLMKKNNFEIMQGVKPEREGDQVEIDAVFRLKGTNNVAIAEIKVGDSKMERPKKGIDQLSTAGSREYLGIYTKKFLITSRKLNERIKQAAVKHNIIVIDGIKFNWRGKTINNYFGQQLIDKLKKEMS